MSATTLDFHVPLSEEIARNVTAALEEDVGSGDLTALLVPAGQKGRATVIAREDAVLCGTAWFERCFFVRDPAAKITWNRPMSRCRATSIAVADGR